MKHIKRTRYVANHKTYLRTNVTESPVCRPCGQGTQPLRPTRSKSQPSGCFGRGGCVLWLGAIYLARTYISQNKKRLKPKALQHPIQRKKRQQTPVTTRGPLCRCTAHHFNRNENAKPRETRQASRVERKKNENNKNTLC